MKSNPLKASIAASLLFYSHAKAVEECTYAHMTTYSDTNTYDQTINVGQPAIHLMFETNALLFRRATSGGIRTELAKDVVYINDGETMLITLRDDCGWSDGFPITAYDMVAGLKRTYSTGAELLIPGREFIKNGKNVVEGVASVDTLGIRAISNSQLEIDITTDGEFIKQILSRVNYMPNPTHLSKQALSNWQKGDLARISSGAFYVTSKSNEEISMARNPYFCLGIQPQIQKINVYQTKKASTQIGMFINDTINVAERFATRDLESLRERGKSTEYKKYTEISMNDEIVEYLIEGKDSALKQYPQLREALFMGIDRNLITGIIENAEQNDRVISSLSHPYEGYETRADELFADAYNSRVLSARNMMEKAGFNEKNNLNITIATHYGFNDVQVANAIGAMWSQIHVDTEILDLTGKTSKERKAAKFDYDLGLIGSDFSDPSDFIYTFAVFGTYENSMEFEAETLSTFEIGDHKKRWEALAKIDEKLLRQRRALPLAVITTPWILSDELELGDYFYLYASNLKSKTCK